MHRGILGLPFFGDEHRQFATELREWALANISETHAHHVDAECVSLVRAMGEAGWLRHAVPSPHGGARDMLDVRTLCLARETLARVAPLADFAFAMQGLGSGPISLFGSEELKARYLPPVSRGEAIAAFAISERDAGSDVAAMQTTARRDGDNWILNGEKTWISNAGIANHYVVFARVDGAEREFIALVVEPSDKGFSVPERITTIAPHPLGTLRFDDCAIPTNRVIGAPGKGLRVALGTLDVFRSTVGAAALGMARRALDETLTHVSQRRMFGQALKDFQVTQGKLAAMSTALDTSALLIYRAAWMRDQGAERITREAAMAKSYATEAAQRVIDDAVQLLGARGVQEGNVVERLYREIRALRIYEGTTEVQQLVIAAQLLAAHEAWGGVNG